MKTFTVDDEKFTTDAKYLSVAEIRELAKIEPYRHVLVWMGVGMPSKELKDTDSVKMEDGLKFETVPPTSY